jgi:hypothetical protein
MIKVFKVKYLRGDGPYRVNEIAAWPLARAVELCAAGVCRPSDDDPELLAAVKAYRAPRLHSPWELPLVNSRWPGWRK